METLKLTNLRRIQPDRGCRALRWAPLAQARICSLQVKGHFEESPFEGAFHVEGLKGHAVKHG